tara:strand:+ start:16236 stop:16808 length:573 start_codon:yes stop_codon:yes gene_type:complete
MTTGIVDVVAEAIVTLLTSKCQTLVSTGDASYADTVKVGRLNADPGTTHGNHISVLVNNPTGQGEKEWFHAIARIPTTMGPHTMLRGESGMDWAEIGGAEYWWRRFTLDLLAHYAHKGYTQGNARQYASTFFSRVEEALRDNPLTGSDDFGGEITDLYGKVRWEAETEQGAGDAWIWRMFMGVEVLTSTD